MIMSYRAGEAVDDRVKMTAVGRPSSNLESLNKKLYTAGHLTQRV